MPPHNTVIGIDLGTTNSCVAVCQNGKVLIITNPEGFKETPSEVGFRDSERSVGNAAKNLRALNSKNSIFNIKRLIGRRLDDSGVQAASKTFPFPVIARASNWPAVEVDFQGRRQQFTPEQISAMIIHKMRKSAERYLGHKVDSAVITVPACFNNEQRQATKDAAEIAGLNVLRLINEPTAAALAYGIERGILKSHRVLVFDFGGGTFDVSIVTIFSNFTFTVLATSGNPNLGGTDFDERLLKHFSEEFKMKHQKDITNNPRAMRRLRTACELTKIRLSTNIDAPLEVDALFDGIDFYTTITREKFEELCEDLFPKIFHPIETALHDAKLKKSEIGRILLVGGSTRIPKLQELLKKIFDGKELNNYINADEAVAFGAAVYAAALSGVRINSVRNIKVLDIFPFNIDVQVNQNYRVFRQNTPMHEQNVFEVLIGKMKYSFQVFERNEKILELGLADLTSFEKIFFTVDKNGIFKLKLEHKTTRDWHSVSVEDGRLTTTKKNDFIEKMKEYEREEEADQKRLEAKYQLEEKLSKMKTENEKNEAKLSKGCTSLITIAIETSMEWLQVNEETATEEEFQSKCLKLKKLVETYRSEDVIHQIPKKRQNATFNEDSLMKKFKCGIDLKTADHKNEPKLKFVRKDATLLKISEAVEMGKSNSRNELNITSAEDRYTTTYKKDFCKNQIKETEQKTTYGSASHQKQKIKQSRSLESSSKSRLQNSAHSDFSIEDVNCGISKLQIGKSSQGLINSAKSYNKGGSRNEHVTGMEVKIQSHGSATRLTDAADKTDKKCHQPDESGCCKSRTL